MASWEFRYNSFFEIFPWQTTSFPSSRVALIHSLWNYRTALGIARALHLANNSYHSVIRNWQDFNFSLCLVLLLRWKHLPFSTHVVLQSFWSVLGARRALKCRRNFSQLKYFNISQFLDGLFGFRHQDVKLEFSCDNSTWVQVGNDRFWSRLCSERTHQVLNLGHSSLTFKCCTLWYALHTEINFDEVSFRTRLLAAWLFVVLHLPSTLQHDFRSKSWRRNPLVQNLASSGAHHFFNVASWHWVMKDEGVRSGLPELQSFVLCFFQIANSLRPEKCSTCSGCVLFLALLNHRILLRLRHQQGLKVWRRLSVALLWCPFHLRWAMLVGSIESTVKEVPTWYKSSFHLGGVATWFDNSGATNSPPEWPWMARTYKRLLFESTQYWNLGLLLLLCVWPSHWESAKSRAPSRSKSRRRFGNKELQWTAASIFGWSISRCRTNAVNLFESFQAREYFSTLSVESKNMIPLPVVDQNRLFLLLRRMSSLNAWCCCVWLLNACRTHHLNVLRRVIHVAVWTSGYHNPGVRSVSRRRRYLYLNSILIKTAYGPDLTNWTDPGVSTNPPN